MAFMAVLTGLLSGHLVVPFLLLKKVTTLRGQYPFCYIFCRLVVSLSYFYIIFVG